ncbi:MAG TPA: class I tRNA ligase family protein [Thermoanaerobaculia bacterium]|nr:class I tRNA ligase family protein [Thermoanaerobaculia bacterium]
MKRVLITATPPTPNGDLHVGHLSGPYLAGDVYKRYCRLAGLEAFFITGGDDNQTYVATKAEQLGTTPEKVAERFDDAIVETLRRAQIEVDIYVRPLRSPRHARFITEFVERLYADGKLIAREAEAAWCEKCQRFLFEAFLSGTCPHCGVHSDGNVCEVCAQPNLCVDLIDAACKRCGGAVSRRTVRRLFFPLSPYAERLREYFPTARMGAHLAALCDTMLAEGLPDIPVSNPADWGIPVPVPGFEGQRLYAWFEMAPGYLSATQEMLEALGRPESWRDFWGSDEAAVVQFFGYDNSYFHTVLFTAEMLAFDASIHLPAAFVTNEFYRLDGQKFSTSRVHAIWGQEILDHLPADLLRYYLCLDRPEAEQTNFQLHDFRAATKRDLVGLWQPWLGGLGRKVREQESGIAPAPGRLTASQERFAAELADLIETASLYYQRETFSPHRIVTTLNRLVDAAHAFGAAESHWRAGATEERRSALALELSAAATLALLASPIMPGFGARLWAELGFPAAPAAGDWPSRPVAVPSGRAVTGMEAPYFEGIDAGCDALLAARAGGEKKPIK